MWRALRSQHFFRMRIEREHDRRSIRRARVFGRSGDDRLMSAVNAVENADREKERSLQSLELGNRSQDFHCRSYAPRIRETCGKERIRCATSSRDRSLI